MASTGARQTARARARAAQQAVIVERKRRDEQNMASLTDYFAAAEQINTARLAMARALDDIRSREGTLSAAATLVGVTSGEARKLLAFLTEHDNTSDSGDETADNAAVDSATSASSADSPTGTPGGDTETDSHVVDGADSGVSK